MDRLGSSRELHALPGEYATWMLARQAQHRLRKVPDSHRSEDGCVRCACGARVQVGETPLRCPGGCGRWFLLGGGWAIAPGEDWPAYEHTIPVSS